MKYIIITITSLLISFNLNAQLSKVWDSYSDEQKREAALDYYNSIKPLFERSIKRLSTEVDSNKVFPWENQAKPNMQILCTILDTIKNSIRYKATDDEFQLNSYLKKDFGYNISDWYELKVLNYNLKDSCSKNVIREGKYELNNWGYGSEIKTSIKQYRKFQKANTLKGNLDIQLGFYTDCQVIHINPTDSGKTFKLDKEKYKVIDIFDNTIVIKKLTGFYDGFNVHSDFNYLCTNENLMPYSYSEEYRQSYALHTENNYEFFVSKPSFVQFFDYFNKNIESLINRDIKRNIIVMKFEGKIINLFFYRRVGFVGKEHRISINNKNKEK